MEQNKERWADAHKQLVDTICGLGYPVEYYNSKYNEFLRGGLRESED